jgi:hypothetical protein
MSRDQGTGKTGKAGIEPGARWLAAATNNQSVCRRLACQKLPRGFPTFSWLRLPIVGY